MTTPTRRIRRAQNSVASGLAALDLREARATIRQKDIVLRAVARAGGDAMLAADALRMERDAAHEECARLTASHAEFQHIARMVEAYYGQIAARLVQVICEQDERLTALMGVADEADALGAECYRLQEDIDTLTADAEAAADALRMERDAAHEECAALRDLLAVARSTLADAHTLLCEDAERIATLTAERDHARAIAVALEQGLTVDTRVPMDSDRTPEVEG